MKFHMLSIGALLLGGAGQVGAENGSPAIGLTGDALGTDKRGLRNGKGRLANEHDEQGLEDNRRRLHDLYPDCHVPKDKWVGDGICDKEGGYNTAACGYDGGDCCQETCKNRLPDSCFHNPFKRCKDIRWPIPCMLQELDCKDPFKACNPDKDDERKFNPVPCNGKMEYTTYCNCRQTDTEQRRRGAPDHQWMCNAAMLMCDD